MAKVSDLTAGRFMTSDDIVDGTRCTLNRIEEDTAMDPKTSTENTVHVAYFNDMSGKPIGKEVQGKVQGMILNKTNLRKLGELGIEDTDDPIPEDFPVLELYLVDTSMGQGTRLKASPDQDLVF